MSQKRDLDSSFYHFDGIKNTSELSGAAGTVTDEYAFDVWGLPRGSTGSTANAHTFKGQLLAYRGDPDAGPEESIYSLHHRDYVAQQGRLRSEDPAEDDLNLYRYVENDPVNGVDPSGLQDAGDQLIAISRGGNIEYRHPTIAAQILANDPNAYIVGESPQSSLAPFMPPSPAVIEREKRFRQQEAIRKRQRKAQRYQDHVDAIGDAASGDAWALVPVIARLEKEGQHRLAQDVFDRAAILLVERAKRGKPVRDDVLATAGEKVGLLTARGQLSVAVSRAKDPRFDARLATSPSTQVVMGATKGGPTVAGTVIGGFSGSVIASAPARTGKPSTREESKPSVAPRAEIDEAAAGVVPTNAVKVTAPIDFDGHILNAEIKASGKVVGGHSTATGQVKVIEGTASAPNANGVYRAKIEVADPNNPGQFLPKTNNGGWSTMFPDSWSADRVKIEVDAAFKKRTVNVNKWSGTTPSGVRVEGYLQPKTTVYPIY